MQSLIIWEREEVGLALLVHGDLAVVLQQDGADGLGGLESCRWAHRSPVSLKWECPAVVRWKWLQAQRSQLDAPNPPPQQPYPHSSAH